MKRLYYFLKFSTCRISFLIVCLQSPKYNIFFFPFKWILKTYLRRIYFIFIGKNAKIGKGLLLGHPFSIVIGDDVIVGNNCMIYHNVTIGQKNGSYPRIGDNVVIYPGTVIVGDIEIGDNVVIGANSFVNTNLTSNSIYGGNPVKLIRKKEG